MVLSCVLYIGMPACEADFQSPVCPSISGFLDTCDVTPARLPDAAMTSSAVVRDLGLVQVILGDIQQDVRRDDRTYGHVASDVCPVCYLTLGCLLSFCCDFNCLQASSLEVSS